MNYPAWRKARERAWKRDGNRHSVRTWPLRIGGDELAAVLLMQSHGGHRRGQPAEIAIPTFAHGVPSRGHDIEHPYEPLALALLVSWIKLALADERHAALLAPPLIDLIGRVPKPRIPAISASPGRSSQASHTSIPAGADKPHDRRRPAWQLAAIRQTPIHDCRDRPRPRAVALGTYAARWPRT